MLPCALLGPAAEATEHAYESYLLPFVSHGDKTWVLCDRDTPAPPTSESRAWKIGHKIFSRG